MAFRPSGKKEKQNVFPFSFSFHCLIRSQPFRTFPLLLLFAVLVAILVIYFTRPRVVFPSISGSKCAFSFKNMLSISSVLLLSLHLYTYVVIADCFHLSFACSSHLNDTPWCDLVVVSFFPYPYPVPFRCPFPFCLFFHLPLVPGAKRGSSEGSPAAAARWRLDQCRRSR